MTAVRAEDHILAGKMGGDTGRDRFLADVGVAAARHLSSFDAPHQLLFGFRISTMVR
ncbi:MAG: hypothetical protein R2843_13590 [Thermomicrobiales bacterium]